MKLYEDCYVGALENGLKILAEPRKDRPLSVGIWVRTGSRDEPLELNGITHFVEHMLFKGTKNRTAFQISEEIDALGGFINGMTHKEYTLFYVDVLPQHLERALDVLADLVKNPLFKEEDIHKEKGVILEEIRMVEDDPQEKVFDLFVENLFKGHPLARPILGQEASIKSLNRDACLKQFELYNARNMILVAVGDVKFGELQELAQAKLGDIGRSKELPPRLPPTPKPHFHVEDKNSHQAHLCLGVAGIDRADPRRFALEVLNAILGGGMSSRLFKRIREELGLAYAVGSSPSFYLDSGLFVIYIGTEPMNAAKTIEIAQEEMKKLVQEPVPTETLRLAKEKLKGNLVLGLESSHARMMRLGVGEIYDLHMPIDDIIARIEAVTTDEVQAVAQALFKEEALSLTVIGPEKELSELAQAIPTN